MNQDRWYKSNSFWILIVVLGLVPLVLNGIMPIVPSVGDDNGWLGFWGGYLGAAITVLGVYIQIDLTNKSTRKLEAVKSRPYFCLNIEEADIFEQNYFKNKEDRQQLINLYNHQFDEARGITTTDDNGKVVPLKIKLPGYTRKFVRIQNISIHHSFSVDVVMKFKKCSFCNLDKLDNMKVYQMPMEIQKFYVIRNSMELLMQFERVIEYDRFRIHNIKPYDEMYLYVGNEDKLYKLLSIELIFLTEFREKIKLYFQYDIDKKEFKHIKDLNVLEETSSRKLVKETFKNYNPSGNTSTVVLNLTESKPNVLTIDK